MRYSETNRKKRGKRRKKHYFLNFFIVALVIAGLWFIAFRSGIFDIHKISVAGSGHYTKARVIELSGVQTGDNIFKTRVTEVEQALEKDPYIRAAHVKWALPDGLEIELEERSESVLVADAEGYVVLDFDGVVLRLADEAPLMPVITGLTPEDPVPGSALKVEEAGQLKPGLDFVSFIGNSDFYVKKLELGGAVPRAYVFDQLVIEGELKNIEKNIGEIKRVVADLDSKGIVRGTVSVGGRGTCSFSPEIRQSAQ